MSFTLPIEEEIEIYRGTLEAVADDGASGQGTGRIALTFQPRPELVWQMQWKGGIPDFALGDEATLPQRVTELRLAAGSITRSLVLSIPHDGLGGVCREVRIGSPTEAVDEIEFFLPNFGFSALGREATGVEFFTVETRLYMVRIAKPSNYRAIVEHLRRTGGYAYTARGVLRRRDNTRISADESQKLLGPDGLLTRLGWFLSFANGGLTFPAEINGIVETWQSWRFVAPPRITPWSHRAVTWCSDTMPGQLDEYCKAFQRFRALLNVYPWSENVPLLIDWYLTVLEPSITEQRIISTQTALELFAWNRLVLDRSNKNRVPVEEYEDTEKFPFRKKLKRILDEMHFDYSAPIWPGRSPAPQPPLDAVDDFVEFRNNVVHPRPRSALRSATAADRFLVFLEGVKYLELLLLHLVGYGGTYDDRRSASEIPVPWSPPRL